MPFFKQTKNISMSISMYYTVPGAIMLIAATALALLAVILFKKRDLPGGKWLLMLIIATFFWSLLAALEDMAAEKNMRIIFSKLAYPAIASGGVLWFIFIIRYVRKYSWLGGGKLLPLWIVPVATVIAAFTNELHGLVWPTILQSATGPPFRLYYGTGPLKLTLALYSYGLILIASVIVFRQMIASGGILKNSLKL